LLIEALLLVEEIPIQPSLTMLLEVVVNFPSEAVEAVH
jgi:hypothetical protein